MQEHQRGRAILAEADASIALDAAAPAGAMEMQSYVTRYMNTSVAQASAATVDSRNSSCMIDRSTSRV